LSFSFFEISSKMKTIVALLVFTFLVGFASAANFDGIYYDNRFGGLAYICTEDSSNLIDGETLNNNLQGSVSAKVIITSSDYSYAEGYISGKYYEAGPTPRKGTFLLKTNDAKNILAGWYYPSDDLIGTGWPWTLTLLDSTDPTSYYCLYRQNATSFPDINGQWGGASGTATFCNDDEGTLNIAATGESAYVTGDSHDDNTVIVGRYIVGTFPTDPKEKSTTYCIGTVTYNYLVKVISDPAGNFVIAGWSSEGTVYSPTNAQWFVSPQVSSTEDTSCADNANRLASCDPGEVGGPILHPLRNSAAGLFVSFAVIVFAVIAVL
jgi:hypothetical protein